MAPVPYRVPELFGATRARLREELARCAPLELYAAGALLGIGVFSLTRGPVGGLLATLGAGLLALEIARKRPSLWLALPAMAAIGGSFVHQPDVGWVPGLFVAAAIALSLSRDRRSSLVLTQVLYLTLAAIVVILDPPGLSDGRDRFLLLNFLAINVAGGLGYELGRWQRSAAKREADAEANLGQTLRYVEDMRTALSEARALREAIVALRAEDEADAVLYRLVSQARRHTRADGCGILLPDPAGGLSLAAVESAEGGRLAPEFRSLPEATTLAQEVMRSRAARWLYDLPASAEGGEPARFGLRSLGLVPILVKSRVHGILAVAWWRERHQFTAGDHELLEALAEQAGVAIERAALRAELAERAEGAEALHRVAADIAGRRDVGDIAENAVSSLRAMYQAEYGAFYLVDEHGCVEALVANGLTPDHLDRLHLTCSGGRRGIPSADAKHRVVVLKAGERRAGLRELMADAGLASLVAVPATSGARTIGGLVLGHRLGRTYEPHEIEMLETFAQQIAGAIDLAHAYGAVEAIDRQREEFLSIVSHELRQPVAAIALIAESLADVPSLRPVEQRALEGLRRQARSLGSLAEDILSIARLESGQFKVDPVPVDLRDLVAIHARGISQPERVTVNLPDEPVMLNVDPERISQVLENLLSNALKYSPPGAPVDLDLYLANGEAVLEVTDQGVGFANDELGRLFQKYGRISNERTAGIGGVGLGLYLTSLLVTAHGGTISASSRGPGVGSTFRVALPALTGRTAQRALVELNSASTR